MKNERPKEKRCPLTYTYANSHTDTHTYIYRRITARIQTKKRIHTHTHSYTMSSWAERVHRRAADLGNVVTSCGHPATAPAYPYRLEKVKFGVPLDEVCKHNNNIPGPLLVLILKLNKESPNRRDVFRAPGHQGAMKKLIHFLQAGRLVNVDNYSVFTIASVLKKFLRKIPNGIFGRSGEMELFAINELQNEAEQTERLHR